MKNSVALVMFASVIVANAARAQVGHQPTNSPYKDLEYAQEFSFVAGAFHGHRDPANVGPQSGALFGAHYEWRAGGPAHLIADISRISSDRRLINPAVKDLFAFRYEDFTLEGYEPHPHIKAAVSV